MAVFHHANGQHRRNDAGLRGAGALGGCSAAGDAHPLGPSRFALLPDGRAAELRAEPDHDQDRLLINKKVVSFIITGGQDNIQSVAGQLLGFFSELGFYLPQFPYIAHSRGWTAEDMEQNVVDVKQSEALREGARALVERAVATASLLLKQKAGSDKTVRGGRKAQRLEVQRAKAASA